MFFNKCKNKNENNIIITFLITNLRQKNWGSELCDWLSGLDECLRESGGVGLLLSTSYKIVELLKWTTFPCKLTQLLR